MSEYIYFTLTYEDCNGVDTFFVNTTDLKAHSITLQYLKSQLNLEYSNRDKYNFELVLDCTNYDIFDALSKSNIAVHKIETDVHFYREINLKIVGIFSIDGTNCYATYNTDNCYEN